MEEFPEFLRNGMNAVKPDQQSRGADGYIYDGIDGSQVILWQAEKEIITTLHTHDYDEWFLIVRGTFKGIIGEEEISMGPGDEILIPRGIPHRGSYSAGFRSIHGFSAKRADRDSTRQ
ncbi:MAG: cupin domain-containing protein [Thermoplasmatota archaeon]